MLHLLIGILIIFVVVLVVFIFQIVGFFSCLCKVDVLAAGTTFDDVVFFDLLEVI